MTRNDMPAPRKRKIYDLTCNDCAFERVVEGEIGDVLDVIEKHQAEHRKCDQHHIVDTVLRE